MCMHWLFLSLENGCQFGLMLLHVSVPKSRHHSCFCWLLWNVCWMCVGCCGMFVGCCGMFVGCCGMFVGCCGMCVGCWNVCWSDDGESAVAVGRVVGASASARHSLVSRPRRRAALPGGAGAVLAKGSRPCCLHILAGPLPRLGPCAFSVFSGDGVRARAWVVRVRTRDVSGTGAR